MPSNDYPPTTDIAPTATSTTSTINTSYGFNQNPIFTWTVGVPVNYSGTLPSAYNGVYISDQINTLPLIPNTSITLPSGYPTQGRLVPQVVEPIVARAMEDATAMARVAQMRWMQDNIIKELQLQEDREFLKQIDDIVNSMIAKKTEAKAEDEFITNLRELGFGRIIEL